MKNTNDDRTLSQFVKAKLSGMNARSFAAAMDIPYSTLYWQWENEKYNYKVREMVEEYYFQRYKEL